jgi:hypothetical protein
MVVGDISETNEDDSTISFSYPHFALKFYGIYF